jgi:hypothetical protein
VFESQAQYSSLVIADFNADGFGDLCYQVQGNDTAGAYAGLYGSQLNIYYGGAAMDSIADWIYKGGKAYTVTGTSDVITPRYFSPWYMDTGDFNGDGYTDLLTSGWNAYSSISAMNYLGAQQSMYNCGAGLIFLGGPEFGGDAIPDVILMASNDWLKYTTPAQYLWLGYAIYNAGDLNGDGIDDISLPGWYIDICLLFAGQNSWTSAGSDAEVLVVRDELLSYTKGRFNFAAYTDQMGMNISSIGDVNGDGLGDLGLTRSFFGGYAPEERGIRLFFTRPGASGPIKPDYETSDYLQVMPGGIDYDNDGVSEFLAYDANFQLTVLKVNPVSIGSVTDTPFDQGGSVRLAFNSTVDVDLNEYPYFSIWRSLPSDNAGPISREQIAQMTRNFTGKAEFTSQVAGVAYRWEWVKNVPAQMLTSYAATVPTAYDSTSLDGGKHYFVVVAHTANPNTFFMSAVDSGYSMDNLAPARVMNIAGVVEGSNARITWDRNSEADLKQYVIYKSSTPDIPDGAAPYATTTEATYLDPVALTNAPTYYAVKAEDVHFNLSPKSDELNISLVGVETTDTSIPTEYVLHQNYPNPFNPSTTIRFGLKAANPVVMRVMNVLGEQVSEINLGELPAGWHEYSFDASHLATGIYLYQIRAGSFVETRRMMLVK